MRITWVTRSFLDYRIPLYKALNELCGGQLTLIYNAEVVPLRCQNRISEVLGVNVIGLKGELRLGGQQVDNASFANSGIRIPLQKGLIKRIKKTKPDIILSDGFFQWTYGAYWLRIFNKVPHLMLYERTKHTERHAPWWRTLLRKTMLPFIDRIGCNGEETFAYLTETLNVSPTKLFLGNMAADNSGLATRVSEFVANQGQTVKETLFLYVGQLIERKGLQELLEVWGAFEKEVADVKLQIIGTGDQEQHLKQYCKDKGLQQVEFLGRIDYDDIVQYYAHADLFIIPTLEDNWSLVVPEAMSCGLPILSSKYNGCWPELVTPENGWVFDSLDQEQMRSTLTNVMAKKEQWSIMGKASKRIVANYSPEKIATAIFESCKNVIQ